MRELSSPLGELSSRFRGTSSLAEASELIRAIGACEEGPVKTMIAYAAGCLGWIESRAKHVWYRKDSVRITADEMDRLREVADREYAKRAIKSVVALREHMAKAGAERHGAVIGHLDRALRSLGAEVCALDDEGKE